MGLAGRLSAGRYGREIRPGLLHTGYRPAAEFGYLSGQWSLRLNHGKLVGEKAGHPTTLYCLFNSLSVVLPPRAMSINSHFEHGPPAGMVNAKR